MYEGVLTGKGLTLRRIPGKNRSYRLWSAVPDTGTAETERYRSWLVRLLCVSGAGNVAIYAIEKAQQLGAKVVYLFK